MASRLNTDVRKQAMLVKKLLSVQVVVVGCCFLDFKELHTRAGAIARSVHHGGIGRNVAENIAESGVDVGFITMARPGMAPGEIFARLLQTRVSVAALEMEGAVGEFHAEIDSAGNLVRSSAVLPRVDGLSWSFVSAHLNAFKQVGWIAFEAGLNPAMLTQLLAWASRHGIRTCALPTRLRQDGLSWNVLRGAGCLVLNQYEAALILGARVNTTQDAFMAARLLSVSGIAKVAITMGSQGVVAVEDGGAPMHYAPPAANAVDSTGAGDAFAAGVIASLATGKAFSEGIRAGLKRARLTVESFESSLPTAAESIPSAWRLRNGKSL